MSPGIELDLGHLPEITGSSEAIGAIGSGFIMRDIQLPAYREAGFDVRAIASRSPENARIAAEQNGIDRVYDDWRELIRDPEVTVLDIAYPPDQQLEIVEAAAEEAGHIKGILAQKPMATSLAGAAKIVDVCRESGIVLAVNQNMRYDQSIRALKTLLERGDLGEPQVAQIIMNVHPDWQPFVAEYGRAMLLNMSVHHIDAFRYLFGDPTQIMASVAPDPLTAFEHRDGSAFYVLEFDSPLRAVAIENASATQGTGISWRVDGTEGMATGTIGWPDYPDGSPSTIEFRTNREPGYRFCPEWTERWFPQGFAGTMWALLDALQTGTAPVLDGADNLVTMALIEAAYQSVEERRAVRLDEWLSATQGVA